MDISDQCDSRLLHWDDLIQWRQIKEDIELPLSSFQPSIPFEPQKQALRSRGSRGEWTYEAQTIAEMRHCASLVSSIPLGLPQISVMLLNSLSGIRIQIAVTNGHTDHPHICEVA